MKIDLKELGKRIKLTRKGQDLTQEMLAEKAGVSQHYIYEIEVPWIFLPAAALYSRAAASSSWRMPGCFSQT